MMRTLRDVGCYITTQFGNIAPADKVQSTRYRHNLIAYYFNIYYLPSILPYLDSSGVEGLKLSFPTKFCIIFLSP